MATTLDPTSPQPADPTTSAIVAGGGAWRRISLLVLGSLLACSIGAWLGYRSHVSPPQTDAAAPAAARAEPAASEALAAGLGDNEQLVADAAAPTRSASGLPWPMWEFRLGQPIPPREPSLTPPTWRLVGSSLTGGKWSVIILRQGNATPEYFSVGQELPGGYRIEAISDEDVTLAHGKRLMVLSYIGSR